MTETKINDSETAPNAKTKTWADLIRFFSRQNAGRPTRLGVFTHEGNIVNDYWLESGLRLNAMVLSREIAGVSIQITVGDLKHEAQKVIGFSIKLSYDGDEDGIDIYCSDGCTTVLRFEVGDEGH